MITTDLIGSVGTVMMLVAFLLNITDKLDNDHFFYIILNFFGSTLACIASCMIPYTPFIILEGTWAIISAWGIVDWFQRRTKAHEAVNDAANYAKVEKLADELKVKDDVSDSKPEE